ncbi:MAG TPA: DUF6176 family protein [Bacteroidia bacterium]|jgi:Holliday junction resolvasome RuvABC endonuclease subunit
MNTTHLNNLKSGCVKIKIKEGMLSRVYEWKEFLNSNKEEVIESLRQEGVFLETVFLDKQGEDNYLIYYMRFRDEEKAKAAFSQSKLNVDKYHAQFKQEVFVGKQELELLIDFINLDV